MVGCEHFFGAVVFPRRWRRLAGFNCIFNELHKGRPGFGVGCGARKGCPDRGCGKFGKPSAACCEAADHEDCVALLLAMTGASLIQTGRSEKQQGTDVS
jgi:hypothetical protein